MNKILHFERAAMRNETMPEGLTLSEQKCFMALRLLYQHFKAGYIPREQAALDKVKIIRQFETERSNDKYVENTSTLWQRIESAGNNYAKNRTLENADKFYRIVYGFDRIDTITRT